MTADELAHVIEQQHAPTLYSYVLVGPPSRPRTKAIQPCSPSFARHWGRAL